MRRAATIVVTAAFWGLGCGGDPASTATPEAPPPAAACPRGTEFIRARDVIGPVRAGYEVVPGDQRRLRALAGQFRRLFGARWRGYDAKVLARRNAANGTAVIVMNSYEKTGSADGIVAGAEAAERDFGIETEPIQVAGEELRLQKTADGAFLAAAPAGTCAIVVLVADTEELVRDTASALRPR